MLMTVARCRSRSSAAEGHDGIAGEDMAPFGEGLVGGDDGGGLFLVTATDDLEEQRRLLVVEPQIADLVNDEQLRSRQHLQVVRHPILREGGLHPPRRLQGGEEQEALAAFGAAEPKGDGEMGLPDAGRTLEDHIPAFIEEAAGAEFLDERAVDGGLESEVKIAEPLYPRQTGEVQAGLDYALTPGRDLRLKQAAEEVRVGPVAGRGLLCDRVELGVRGGGADLQQAVQRELFIVDAHEATSA